MANKTIKDFSAKMRNLDLCMMTTLSKEGELHSRPMSNNGDVEYDGNSYFFTYEDSKVIEELTANPELNLSFEGNDKLFISLQGTAEIIKNKEELKEHWQEDLKQWFKEGVETPGITMIQVKASKIKYWQEMEMEEIEL